MIDAMSEQSEGPATTLGGMPRAIRARVVGLVLVMLAFTAIGMFAYSVYARGAESAAGGEGRGGASTLVRASTLRAESALMPATTAPPLLVETARVVPAAAPRADRVEVRDVARIRRVRTADVKLGGNAGSKGQAPKPRYWRATTAEPDVGF